MPKDEYWGPTARDLREESKETCLVGEWPCQAVEQEQELVLLSEGGPGSLSMGHLCIPVKHMLLPWRKTAYIHCILDLAQKVKMCLRRVAK